MQICLKLRKNSESVNAIKEEKFPAKLDDSRCDVENATIIEQEQDQKQTLMALSFHLSGGQFKGNIQHCKYFLRLVQFNFFTYQLLFFYL